MSGCVGMGRPVVENDISAGSYGRNYRWKRIVYNIRHAMGR